MGYRAREEEKRKKNRGDIERERESKASILYYQAKKPGPPTSLRRRLNLIVYVCMCVCVCVCVWVGFFSSFREYNVCRGWQAGCWWNWRPPEAKDSSSLAHIIMRSFVTVLTVLPTHKRTHTLLHDVCVKFIYYRLVDNIRIYIWGSAAAAAAAAASILYMDG
jgi:hypothetical protein